eukprot:Gb_01094 [translate_table: standard]
MQNSMTVGSLPKCEHGQGKRVKSRWEPVADEKLDEKQGVPLSHEFNREVVWGHLKEGQNKGSVKWDTKDGVWNGAKELQLHQPLNSINTSKRAAKKARKGNGLDASGGGDSSSEIDEEAGHGGSCFASRGLADTQEEMKRRQNRTKRFDKENETNTKTKGPIMKTGGASSGSARGATALLLAKNYGDSGGRAVEDIDWDSLTVKGTCQEIEKCYLRLTSAPDPNTVRPEEVLQKALVMVKNSTKNYLYKCEQLKSIRQDLTVQRIRNELTAKVKFLSHSLQTPFFDSSTDPLRTRALDPIELGFHKVSSNMVDITLYGKHVLGLYKAHDLIIFNGIAHFTDSWHYTYFPRAGGTGVVDYILTTPALLPFILHFSVSPRLPLEDRAYLTLAFPLAKSPLTHPTTTLAPHASPFPSYYYLL